MYLEYTLEIDPQWAWSPYEPNQKSPWTLEKAGHLLRRAAFGGNWSELQLTLRDGPAKTINRLFHPSTDATEHFYRSADQLAAPLAGTAQIERLRAWWLYLLINSPHPLLEKMTLFWHNHFATSNAKVQDVGAMLRQNQLLRQHALGRFGPLLQDISKDPAMLVWLDGITNQKGKPNENYARELMELFSLGIGHYSETDIREAARAFTGWTIKQERYYFDAGQHDDQAKTVFARKGSFKGEEIVQLCLNQPACARFLVTKLIRYFISETLQPSVELVEPLAKQLRDSNYDVNSIVKVILSSNVFFSDVAYRARVKSPIEFTIGLIHALEGRADTIQLDQTLDALGQRLFAPPSVKGWDGGSSWLNSTTLLLRHNLAAALTSTVDQRFYNRCDPIVPWRKYSSADDLDLKQAGDFFLGLFLQSDIPQSEAKKIQDRAATLRQQKYPAYWTKQAIFEHQVRSLCHLILTLPECQLG